MIVGKTWSSIEKSEIFSLYSEAEVLTSVLPDIDALPCLISSPLRVDKHPSFSIYQTPEGHIRYADFATGDKGSLLDLLCAYWHCSFRECLDKLSSLLIKGKDINIKPKNLKTLTRKEAPSHTSIQVVVRPWRQDDFTYWASYGVEKKWLKKAEVYPISYKIITKKENPKSKGRKIIFPADKYAYCFVERKEGNLSLKIYQPFNTKGFKWCSSMDSSVISLWSLLPPTGDKVVICSSLKDALCLRSQLHIPSIAPQGEGYNLSATAIKVLKERFKQVFICYDTDKAGLQDSHKLASSTGFINVIPSLGASKDLSDYYKSLTDKSQFQKLIQLFNTNNESNCSQQSAQQHTSGRAS